MSDVLNRTTLEYLHSVSTPRYPVADWVINPDMSAVAGVPRKYWKLTGDAVLPMDAAERAAVDAAEAAAAAARVDGEQVILLRKATLADLPTEARIDQHAPTAALIALVQDRGNGSPAIAIYAGGGRWLVAGAQIHNAG